MMNSSTVSEIFFTNNSLNLIQYWVNLITQLVYVLDLECIPFGTDVDGHVVMSGRISLTERDHRINGCVDWFQRDRCSTCAMILIWINLAIWSSKKKIIYTEHRIVDLVMDSKILMSSYNLFRLNFDPS